MTNIPRERAVVRAYFRKKPAPRWFARRICCMVKEGHVECRFAVRRYMQVCLAPRAQDIDAREP